MTPSQFVQRMEAAGAKGVGAQALYEALDRAVDDGRLSRVEGRLTPEPQKAAHRELNATAQRSATRVGKDQLDQAVQRVVASMETAREDSALLRVELRDARAANNEKLVERLEGQLKDANKKLGLTATQFRAAVRAELGEGYRIANQTIDAAAHRATEAGHLHKNVDRLSVETVEQTDKRMAGELAERNAWRSASRDAALDVRKAASLKQHKERQQAAKKELAAKREVALKKLTPQQRRAIETKRTRQAVRLVKETARFVRNPVRGTARLAIKVSAKATMSLGKAVLGAPTLMTLAVTKGLLVSAGSRALGNRSYSYFTQQQTDRRAQLGRQKAVTRLSTLTYRENSAGELYRAKFSVTNIALVTAAAMMEKSGLSTKGPGLMAAHNTLLGHIQTKRVNAAEALLGKAVIAVARAVGRKMAAASVQRNYSNKLERLRPAFEQQREAYLHHLKASLDHRSGRIDDMALNAAKARLDASTRNVEKLYARAERGADKELTRGHISAQQYERVREMRKEFSHAAQQLRERGDVSVDKKAALLGANLREVKKLELKAGVDVLGLTAERSKTQTHERGARPSRERSGHNQEVTASRNRKASSHDVSCDMSR